MKPAPLLAAFALAALSAAACDPRRDEPPARETGSPEPAAPTAPMAQPKPGAPAASAGAPTDWPPACVAYGELIGKLETCDKIGGARGGILAAYDRLRAAWDKAPASQRASLAAQCQRQADGLRNAVAATCGW